MKKKFLLCSKDINGNYLKSNANTLLRHISGGCTLLNNSRVIKLSISNNGIYNSFNNLHYKLGKRGSNEK